MKIGDLKQKTSDRVKILDETGKKIHMYILFAYTDMVIYNICCIYT